MFADRSEREAEVIVRKTLESVVLTDMHPRMGITITLQVPEKWASLNPESMIRQPPLKHAVAGSGVQVCQDDGSVSFPTLTITLPLPPALTSYLLTCKP